jgi:hypothetical protein
MWRMAGILLAVVGLFISQSIYNVYLSWTYTELEATLVGYQEDCFFEKDRGHGPYFDCGQAPPISTVAPAGDPANYKIEKHAKLLYQYRVPAESQLRQAGTETWAVAPGKHWVGQKRNISIKKDDPTKVLWSRLVV